MKKIVLLMTACAAALASTAQQPSGIEVSYTAHYPNFRNGKAELTNQYILHADASASKFYSPMTEYIDSLNSTPEGKSKYQQMSTNAYLGGNMDKLPRKDGSYYVTKSMAGGKVGYYDNAGMDRYRTEEILEDWNWQIGDSTKTVLGYECQQATVDFHGRRWTAWFAPDLPVMNGPWKLGGLPGLILEASADGGLYRFVATGLQSVSKPIGEVYLADEYEKISRKDFLKAKRAFLENPLGKIDAQLGVTVKKVTTVDEDGNTLDVTHRIFVPRENVDFIETDY